MNDHSGAFPNDRSALSVPKGHGAPAIAGLREAALAEAKNANRFDPTEVWRIISRWWWLIAAITVSCLMAGILISLLVTPQYRAAVTLEVNPEGVQVVKMGELEPVRMGDREFMTTQAGLLRSRSLAERVSRSLNLAANPSIADPEADRDAREGQAVDLLQGSVQVQPERDSRLIYVTAQSADPSLAARIANSYSDNFIQSNLERRYEATSYARDFLEERIATVKARLEISERELVAYAQRQGIITLNVDSGDGSSGRSEQSLDAASLVSLNEALSTAKSERIAAEQRFRQSQNNLSTTEVMQNPTVQALTGQRATLQGQYQEKLGIYKPDFPEMVQLQSRIDALTRSIRQESANVGGALRSDYAAAVARESALQARVNGLKGSLLNLRERSIRYTILQREVDTNRSLYDALLQRFKEVGVAGGVGANVVSVVDRAEVPQAPFKPDLPFNIVVGLIAGLALGFGTAFAIEWIDDTIKTPDDLTAKLGISPLGVIPNAPKGTQVQEQLDDQRSRVSESYQSVRAALQFSTDHGIPKTLLVTSTRAAEGKSSSALALAQTLARLGSTVLLIDSDLRKPTFRGPSGSTIGLSSLLAGADTVSEAIHRTNTAGLFLLPSGPIPPNPAELLASERLHIVLAEVSGMFDQVVIDGPPVLGLADAPLLSSAADGTLMVVETGKIRRAAALNTVRRLKAAGAHILGGILTKFETSKTGYGYGYGEDQYSYREGEEPKRQIQLLHRS